MRKALAVSLMLLFTTSLLPAQETRGSIVGTVTDP
jgi:hypothetical protein